MKVKYANEGEVFFIVGYILYICSSSLTSTMFNYNRYFSFMNTILRYGLVTLLLLLSVMYRKLKINNCLFVYIGIFGFLIFNMILSKRKSIVMLMLIIFSAKGISFEKLLKITFKTIFILTILIIGAALTGIIENRVYIQGAGTRIRYSLGFVYANMPSKFFAALTMMYVYIKNKKLCILEALVLLFLNFLIYLFTDTRTPFLLSIVVVAGAFSIKYIIRSRFAIRCLEILTVLCFPLSATLSYIFAVKFVNCHILQALNRVLNNRLLLGYSAIKNYGITILGRNIAPLVGPLELVDNPSLTYNYVDSAYLQLMISEGILFIIILCMSFLILCKRVVRDRNYYLEFILVLISFYAITEPGLLNLVYFPFLLYFNEFFKKRNRILYRNGEVYG